MAQSKTRQYIMYAIGEIILVVIGILIAVSINTYNENRKSEKEAGFQLAKLRDNLNSDKTQIITAIRADGLYIENLLFCLKVLSNEVNASKQVFQESFQYMSSTMVFNPTISAFEGLVASGKIELISNQTLLDAMFSYYNSNLYQSWDSALKEYSRNVIMPFFLNFDHVSNPRDPNDPDVFTQIDFSKFPVPEKTLKDYKNNLFVINALRKKIQLFEGQKAAYVELLGIINSLIDQIDSELGE